MKNGFRIDFILKEHIVKNKSFSLLVAKTKNLSFRTSIICNISCFIFYQDLPFHKYLFHLRRNSPTSFCPSRIRQTEMLYSSLENAWILQVNHPAPRYWSSILLEKSLPTATTVTPNGPKQMEQTLFVQ